LGGPFIFGGPSGDQGGGFGLHEKKKQFGVKEEEREHWSGSTRREKSSSPLPNGMVGREETISGRAKDCGALRRFFRNHKMISPKKRKKGARWGVFPEERKRCPRVEGGE